MKIDKAKRSLTAIKLFREMAEAQIRKIEQQCQWQSFAENQVIFGLAEDSDGIYFVVEGRVRVSNNVESGEAITFADVDAGNFFGELSCFGEQRRSARVVALNDTVVAILPRDQFVAVLKQYPDTAIKLLGHLASIIRNSNLRLVEVLEMTPDQRICTELIKLARPSIQDDTIWLIDPLPLHSEISGRAGTDSKDVSKVVGTLIREGIVRRRNNSLIIKDFPKLRVLQG